jgi:hypothetical protein
MSSSRSLSHNRRSVSCSRPSNTRIKAFTTFACPGSTASISFPPARGAEDCPGQQIANAAQVYTIPMLAHGYKRRPK